MSKVIKMRIVNNSNKLISLSGFLKLNEIELVNCDTTTIEKTIEVKSEEGILIWRRSKEDPLEEGIFILKFKDKNELLIQNAPTFDSVKVVLNGENIMGKFKYKG